MQMPRCSACKNKSRALKPRTTQRGFISIFSRLFRPALTETTGPGNTSREEAPKLPSSQGWKPCAAQGSGARAAEPGPRLPVTPRQMWHRSPGPGGQDGTGTGTAWPGWGQGCKAPALGRLGVFFLVLFIFFIVCVVDFFIYLLILLLIFPAKVLSSRQHRPLPQHPKAQLLPR